MEQLNLSLPTIRPTLTRTWNNQEIELLKDALLGLEAPLSHWKWKVNMIDKSRELQVKTDLTIETFKYDHHSGLIKNRSFLKKSGTALYETVMF